VRKFRVYFSCLMCGLGIDTAQLASPRRRFDLIHAAFKSAAEPRPRWDARHVPHCPRCGGRLLLRQSEGFTRDALEPVQK